MPNNNTPFFFQSGGGLGPSDQATMEGGTLTTFAVTPGVQKYHPGHPKAWFEMTTNAGAPTLLVSFGIASLTDYNVGMFGVNFGTSFTSADYGAALAGAHNPGVQIYGAYKGLTSTALTTGGQFQFSTVSSAFAPADPASAQVGGAFFGDLP